MAIIELILVNQIVSVPELKSHHLNKQKTVPKGSSSERHCSELQSTHHLVCPLDFSFPAESSASRSSSILLALFLALSLSPTFFSPKGLL